MRWLTHRKEIQPRLGLTMTVFTYYLFDEGANMVTVETATHEDIVDAFDRMRTMLDKFEMIAMVQLWHDEEFVGHIRRSDGRLIVTRNADPAPAHPLSQPLPKSKAS
jgi:hypothetical protein